MGLDMYAFRVKTELVGDQQVDVPIRSKDSEKFVYWRKFNALHGWMRELYKSKGGESSDFNCDSVRLMPEDLDRLEREAGALQPCPGFFFGTYEDLTEEDVQDVRAFVTKARAEIANGNAVFYDSWW